MIRKMEAELDQKSKENFDLRIKVSHLSNLTNTAPRDIASPGSPAPDFFYSFDEENQPGSAAKHDTISQFDDGNPVVISLKRELTKHRAEIEKQVTTNHDLEDVVDDLRERGDKLADKAAQEQRAAMEQLQRYVNHVEDLESANLQKDRELKQTQHSLVTANRELVQVAENHREETERKGEMTCARIEGLQLRYSAAVEAMEEERTLAKTATDKMANTSIDNLRLTKELQQAVKEFDTVQANHVEEVRQTAVIREQLEAVQKERDILDISLKAEKQRASLWTESGELVASNRMLLPKGSSALQELVLLLKHQENVYETAGDEYQPRWREEALGDMNECLRALYRSQRELEAQREEFVRRYCHSNFMFRGKPSLQPTHALPTA